MHPIIILDKKRMPIFRAIIYTFEIHMPHQTIYQVPDRTETKVYRFRSSYFKLNLFSLVDSTYLFAARPAALTTKGVFGIAPLDSAAITDINDVSKQTTTTMTTTGISNSTLNANDVTSYETIEKLESTGNELPNQKNLPHDELGRVAKATKLCVNLTTPCSNILLDKSHFAIPKKAGKNDPSLLSPKMSKADAVEILRLGKTRRSLLRLQVLVNSLVDLTLDKSNDQIDISYVRSAVHFVFKFLAVLHEPSSSNDSPIRLEMGHLVETGLRRIFVLAEFHRDVRAIISQNVDNLILDDFGRCALRHLAFRNFNFAVFLQLHLIHSMVDAGSKLQQQLAYVQKSTHDNHNNRSFDIIWGHRHRYQSCAMLLLSTMLNQKFNHKSEERHPHCARTPGFKKTTSNTSSSKDQCILPKSEVTKQFGGFQAIYERDEEVDNRTAALNVATEQLRRLHLDPAQFPSLLVLKKNIMQYLSPEAK